MKIPFVIDKSIQHIVVGIAYGAVEKQHADVLLGVFVGRSKDGVNKLILNHMNIQAAQHNLSAKHIMRWRTIEQWLTDWHYIVYLEEESGDASSTLPPFED